jgi:hypothetical protein
MLGREKIKRKTYKCVNIGSNHGFVILVGPKFLLKASKRKRMSIERAFRG